MSIVYDSVKNHVGQRLVTNNYIT